MTFRFNFPNPNVESDNIKDPSYKLYDLEIKEDNQEDTQEQISRFIEPGIYSQIMKDIGCPIVTTTVGPYTIRYLLTPIKCEKKTDSTYPDDIFQTLENQKTDLVPGVYEGGFKLWECAIDLAVFLENNNCFEHKPTVLELGCGIGIPGLLAYLLCCHVTFQDFNAEVLESMTIPNVMLNTEETNQEMIDQHCSFLAGDWQCIQRKYYQDGTQKKRYGLIVTSETIYETKCHKKLLNLMKCALESNGAIYLAAKTHYFGVGGTLDDFESLVQKDGTFEWKNVAHITEGVARKIIQLTFRDNNC